MRRCAKYLFCILCFYCIVHGACQEKEAVRWIPRPPKRGWVDDTIPSPIPTPGEEAWGEVGLGGEDCAGEFRYLSRGMDGFTKMGVGICYRPDGCVGYIRIINRKCFAPTAPLVSREGGQDDDTREATAEMLAMGPDWFRVRVEGQREALVVKMMHQGNCTYEGIVIFSFRDDYALSLSVIHQNFLGQADPTYGHPRFDALALTPDNEMLTCESPKYSHLEPPDLPTCKNMRSRGRWVESALANYNVKGSLELLKNEWPMKWPTPFMVKFGETMRWEPYACKYQNYPQEVLAKRLSNTQFLFMGDSQTRSLYHPCLNIFSANKTLGNPKIPIKQGASTHVGHNISFTYFVDNYLSQDPLPDIFASSQHYASWFIYNNTKTFDVVVLGMGNWGLASRLRQYGLGMWEFARYRKEVRRIATQLAALRARTGIRILWHTMPAYPLGDGVLKEFDYSRSGARISLWNAFATKAMERAGVEVFDLYDISDVMLHTAVGWPVGHFNDYHVPEMWAIVLMNYLADHPHGVLRG